MKKMWKDCPARTCNSMHACVVCRGTIRLGQKYLDGGTGRRAHVTCIDWRKLNDPVSKYGMKL